MAAARTLYLSLLDAMGISPLTRIKVADVSGRVLSPAMDESIEAVVSQALSRRPDVLSAFHAAEKASQARVRAARAEFMPKVFLSATGAYNSGRVDLTALPGLGQEGPTVNILNDSRFGGTVLAGVTVPLYDGGTRAAALAQAKAEEDSAEARLERARQDAVMQVVHAGNALRTSLAAYSASQALATAAKTTFDGALGAYRNGVGSITRCHPQPRSSCCRRRTTPPPVTPTAPPWTAAATLALVTGALELRAPQS